GVFQQGIIPIMLPLSAFDTISDWKMTDNAKVDFGDGVEREAVVERDSLLLAYEPDSAPLYVPGPDMIIRKFKGQLAINQRTTENRWRLKILQLEKGRHLFVTEIPFDSSSIEGIRLLTALKEYREEEQLKLVEINPSKKELKKILKEDLFEEEDVFLRVGNQ
ncbi:MAG: hypothetical protein AAF206_25615, partial [Bacteroidota bacterium]